MNTEQMREAFEAEMRCEETWGHQSLKRKKCGRYEHWRVDLMWSVWQAALTHPQEPARVGGVPEGWQFRVLSPGSITVQTESGYACTLWKSGHGGVEALAYQMADMLRNITAAPQAPADAGVVRDARAEFESMNRDSHGFKRSPRGTYRNQPIARDWKWFQAGIDFAKKGGQR